MRAIAHTAVHSHADEVTAQVSNIADDTIAVS